MRTRYLVLVLLLLAPVLVSADYTDPLLEISKDNVPGHWRIHKFGHNEALSTALETIWSGSNIYTYPAAAITMNLTSTDADDTMGGNGAWGVTVYGLDGNYNMINETMQLNGQNPIPTTLKYLRVYRVFTRQAGVTGFNEGIIYLGTGASAAGVPTNKYAIIDQNYGQTMMTQFTIPNGYTGYLTRFTISSWTANKNFESYLRIRWIGESWRRIEENNVVAGTSSLTVPYTPPLPIQAKTDIEFIGKVDVAGGVTEINYDLILVKDGYSLITESTDVNISSTTVDLVSNIPFIWALFVVFGIIVSVSPSMIEDRAYRKLAFPLSIVLWFCAMYIWAIEYSGTGFFALTWVHLIPIFLSLAYGFVGLGSSITDKRSKYG